MSDTSFENLSPVERLQRLQQQASERSAQQAEPEPEVLSEPEPVREEPAPDEAKTESSEPEQGRPQYEQRLPMRPRRVRGGIKLQQRAWPMELGPLAARWLQAIGRVASPEAIKEGFEFARSGQTRVMDVQPGAIRATVQGRRPKAHEVTISLETFPPEVWERVLAEMEDSALYTANILSGELPPELERVFETHGVRLLPMGDGDLESDATGEGAGPWCEHCCCVALLIAEMIDREPLMLLTLRGLPADDLVERLRDRRAASANASGGGLVAVPGMPEIDLSASPLEETIGSFWEAGPELDEVETPMAPPEVSHALLRRLGPSPFVEGKFPLVGLLATCYDVISEHALRDEAIDEGLLDDSEVSAPVAEAKPTPAEPERALPKPLVPIDASGKAVTGKPGLPKAKARAKKKS
ncbi:MAG: hypothetical protein AAGD00_01780 [Planctomycetota bacterium]